MPGTGRNPLARLLPDADVETAMRGATRRGSRLLAWLAVLASPLLTVGGLVVFQPAGAPPTRDGDAPAPSATPAGWAEMYVRAWLSATRDDSADLEAFYPSATKPQRAPGTQVPVDTATVSVVSPVYAIAMLLFAILLVCLNTVQVLAPYLLLFEGLLLALALVAALVPSMQHQLAYRVSSIAATIAKLLAGMAFLAVMTVLLRALMLADLGPQLVRFAVIDLVVFSGFLFHKRLTANLQRVRGQVNERIQRLARPGHAAKALPTPVVPAGPDRLARTIKAGTSAFAETFAPAGKLKERLVTAGRAGGRVGGNVVKYTAGAPVSWPQAAHRAQTALTAKAGAAKGALARRADAAKTYTAAYAGNLGAATGALPAWHAAATVLTAVGNRPAGRSAAACTHVPGRENRRGDSACGREEAGVHRPRPGGGCCWRERISGEAACLARVVAARDAAAAGSLESAAARPAR